MSEPREDKRFKPEKYGMIFCPDCGGSGRSFTNFKGTNVCNVCGGFGLIKKEDKKSSKIKGIFAYRFGEFVLEQT